MKSHRQILAERIIRTIYETAKPSGSGGYWADFGPVTYGEMEYFLARRDGGPLPCENCGRAMAEHDAFAHCWGPESKIYTASNVNGPDGTWCDYCTPRKLYHPTDHPAHIDGHEFTPRDLSDHGWPAYDCAVCGKRKADHSDGTPTTSQVASHGGDSPQRGIGGQGRAGTSPADHIDGDGGGS